MMKCSVRKLDSESEVWAPAQVHETQQVIVCGLLNQVVDVTFDGQRQSHHFIPVLYHTLETLIDVLHMGFSLQENIKKEKIYIFKDLNKTFIQDDQLHFLFETVRSV